YGVDDGYFDGILGAVMVAVALVLACLAAAVLIRYACRHKGSYRTNEAKGTEFAETADVALRGDPALRDATTDQGEKEYFI
ncbi:hypothetical protein CRUP_017525, partial [Coryphaenoides rupestris]